VAALGVGVGLAQTRCQPRPRAQPSRVVEPTHVTDLGDEHRAQHRPDPAQRLDRLVAGMALEAAMDPGVALSDLTVIDLDEVAQ
jgi:hypothetical protein